MLEALKQNGYLFEYANEDFINDNEIMTEAVKQDGYSLNYTSKELLDNEELKLLYEEYNDDLPF